MKELWKFHHLSRNGAGGWSEWTLSRETGHLSAKFKIECAPGRQDEADRKLLWHIGQYIIAEYKYDDEGEIVSRTERGREYDLSDAKNKAEGMAMKHPGQEGDR